MTALEQQIKDALIKSSYDGMYESGNVTACAEITKEQMIAFAEWIRDNNYEWQSGINLWEGYDPYNHYRTSELLELYIEHLNNQP